MDYISLESIMKTKFPFSDLQSFRDYVIFVQTYSPDGFHPREGVGPDEQWTLDLAFEGLRQGLNLAVKEKGKRPEFATCHALVEEAHDHYRVGRVREGFFALEKFHKLLRKV